jgi:hypothetical protein
LLPAAPAAPAIAAAATTTATATTAAATTTEVTATAVAAATVATAAIAAATAVAAAATTTAVATTTAAIAAAGTRAGAGLGLEAVAAVDGPVTAGFERDTGFLAAGCTGDGEHLAVRPRAASATTGIALAETTAVGTAAGFVGEPLRCMEFLLTRGERESRPAIDAGQFFVGVRHPTTS